MTISEVIKIENLKCGGCGSTIKKTLKDMNGVENVAIDFDNSEVSVAHTEGVNRQALTMALKKIGYPEIGTTAGLGALTATAKSYISCAIGRMSDDETN